MTALPHPNSFEAAVQRFAQTPEAILERAEARRLQERALADQAVAAARQRIQQLDRESTIYLDALRAIGALPDVPLAVKLLIGKAVDDACDVMGRAA